MKNECKICKEKFEPYDDIKICEKCYFAAYDSFLLKMLYENDADKKNMSFEQWKDKQGSY